MKYLLFVLMATLLTSTAQATDYVQNFETWDSTTECDAIPLDTECDGWGVVNLDDLESGSESYGAAGNSARFNNDSFSWQGYRSVLPAFDGTNADITDTDELVVGGTIKLDDGFLFGDNEDKWLKVLDDNGGEIVLIVISAQDSEDLTLRDGSPGSLKDTAGLDMADYTGEYVHFRAIIDTSGSPGTAEMTLHSQDGTLLGSADISGGRLSNKTMDKFRFMDQWTHTGNESYPSNPTPTNYTWIDNVVVCDAVADAANGGLCDVALVAIPDLACDPSNDGTIGLNDVNYINNLTNGDPACVTVGSTGLCQQGDDGEKGLNDVNLALARLGTDGCIAE